MEFKTIFLLKKYKNLGDFEFRPGEIWHKPGDSESKPGDREQIGPTREILGQNRETERNLPKPGDLPAVSGELAGLS